MNLRHEDWENIIGAVENYYHGQPRDDLLDRIRAHIKADRGKRPAVDPRVTLVLREIISEHGRKMADLRDALKAVQLPGAES